MSIQGTYARNHSRNVPRTVEEQEWCGLFVELLDLRECQPIYMTC